TRPRRRAGDGGQGLRRVPHGGRGEALRRRVSTTTTDEIARVFREESGRAVATMVRFFGDIDVAEEAVQDAFTVAVGRWPEEGLPPNPGGWITTTAKNRAIDRLRREGKRGGPPGGGAPRARNE